MSHFVTISIRAHGPETTRELLLLIEFFFLTDTRLFIATVAPVLLHLLRFLCRFGLNLRLFCWVVSLLGGSEADLLELLFQAVDGHVSTLWFGDWYSLSLFFFNGHVLVLLGIKLIGICNMGLSILHGRDVTPNGAFIEDRVVHSVLCLANCKGETTTYGDLRNNLVLNGLKSCWMVPDLVIANADFTI